MTRKANNAGGAAAPAARDFDPLRDSAAAPSRAERAPSDADSSASARETARDDAIAAPTSANPLGVELIKPDLVELACQMGVCKSGYATNALNFQGMTTRQRAALKRRLDTVTALNERVPMVGARYPVGKVTNELGDVVRDFAERLADAWEAAHPGCDITEGLEF